MAVTSPGTAAISGSSTKLRNAVMVFLAVIYALCYVGIKAGLPFEPPLRFAGFRALVAGLVVLGVLAALKRSLVPSWGQWRWVFGLGLTTTTLAFAAMFLSPGRTGAGIASVLGNTQPIMAVALAVPLLGERLTRGKQAGLVLGTLGVGLIALPAIAGPDAYGISGPALALAASLSLAIGSIIAKRMGPQVDLLPVAAWQLIVGSLPLLLVSAVAEHGPWIDTDLRFLGLLAFLAIAGTALPTPLWYWLLQRDEVGRLSLFLFLVPVLGLLVAAAVFGERVGVLEEVGIAVTVAGIGVAARTGTAGKVPRPVGQVISSGSHSEL